MKKRKLSLFLCLALLLGAFSPMALATEVEPPADDPNDPAPYDYISTISIDLDIVNAFGIGRADCYSSVFVPDTTKTAELTMTLQRRDINSTSASAWTDVTTWSASGTYRVTLDRSYYVTRGYTYRLLIGVDIIYNNHTLETTNADSDYVSFP